ncbi:hypothetical protein L227DRAFT_291740 [Lentinus tigrinus ALCF2SS1-6]|uniref:Uncharacterized protein n=1 Tax=Lentinus tigrinus ALCF2SS1-6 TaxID=1328759 RepID=A0A5C2RYA6_9APHY|nr:hypothetical protein L227DRAFT_291740 [Lentinus tigrinus ALCF2SS1-6]
MGGPKYSSPLCYVPFCTVSRNWPHGAKGLEERREIGQPLAKEGTKLFRVFGLSSRLEGDSKTRRAKLMALSSPLLPLSAFPDTHTRVVRSPRRPSPRYHGSNPTSPVRLSAMYTPSLMLFRPQDSPELHPRDQWNVREERSYRYQGLARTPRASWLQKKGTREQRRHRGRTCPTYRWRTSKLNHTSLRKNGCHLWFQQSRMNGWHGFSGQLPLGCQRSQSRGVLERRFFPGAQRTNPKRVCRRLVVQARMCQETHRSEPNHNVLAVSVHSAPLIGHFDRTFSAPLPT